MGWCMEKLEHNSEAGTIAVCMRKKYVQNMSSARALAACRSVPAHWHQNPSSGVPPGRPTPIASEPGLT